MNIDEVTILFTVISIAIALWAIASEDKKLHLKLRLATFDFILIIFSLALLHYLLLENVLQSLGVYFNFGPWRYGFNKPTAIYFIVVFSGLILFSRLKWAKLKIKKASYFKMLVDSLLAEKRFATLIRLLNQHASTIFSLLRNSEVEKKQSKYLSSAIDNVLSSSAFIKHLATIDSAFSIQLMQYDEVSKSKFFDLYIKELIRNRSSIFYKEVIAESTFVDEVKSPFLFYLFKDVTVAEKLAVYKPVGDEVLRFLKYDQSLIKEYLGTNEGYFEYRKRECPVYASIQFFDLMIMESIRQGIKWHMWLFYFQAFVRQIIDNLNKNNGSQDPFEEFPTVYHYLIYEILTTNIDWIIRGADEVKNSEDLHVKYHADITSVTNANLIASAAISVANIIRLIVSSDKMSERFKSESLEVVLKRVEMVKANRKFHEILEFLKMHIIYAEKSGRKNSYLNSLSNSFSNMDPILQCEFSDYRDAINEAVN